MILCYKQIPGYADAGEYAVSLSEQNIPVRDNSNALVNGNNIRNDDTQ